MNKVIGKPGQNRQQCLDELSITDSDFVLEVGSGNNPLTRSDVLTDKYLEYVPDREYRKLHVDRRPLVICPGENLPFQKGTFTYSIARQVLEYTDDPDKFLKELMRVSIRGGYIEVANGMREAIFDWDARKWVVSLDKIGKLIIRRKGKQNNLGKLFNNLNDPYLEKYITNHWASFNYMVEWSGSIDYEVREETVDSYQLSNEVDYKFIDIVPEGYRARLKEWAKASLSLLPYEIGRSIFNFYLECNANKVVPGMPYSNKPFKIVDKAFCNDCNMSLKLWKQGLTCPICKRAYPCWINGEFRGLTEVRE